MFEKTKNKRKRGRGWTILKKLYRKDENIEKEAGMGQIKNYTKRGYHLQNGFIASVPED